MRKIKALISTGLIMGLPLLALVACGGSSGSSSGIATENDGSANQVIQQDQPEIIVDNQTPVGTNNDNVTDFATVPLRSLPPLSERLYTGVAYGTKVNGPVIGKNLIPNSELIHEIPVDIASPADGVVIEKAYIIDHYPSNDTTVRYDYPEPILAAVITNVSNAMLCDFRFRSLNLEMSNGEMIDTELDIEGYVTIHPKRFNFVSDRYDKECIPAEKSVYAFGSIGFGGIFGTEFRELEDANGSALSGDDVVKLLVDEVEVDVENEREVDTNGLFASVYAPSEFLPISSLDEHWSAVTVSNPSNRNLLNRSRGVVVFIDPATSAPLGEVQLSNRSTETRYILAPGEESQLYYFDWEELNGSTSQVLVMPNWSDFDSR
jgi:hypothetical protein